MIMLFVFCLSFFNTALLILIVNCNFSESENPVLRRFLSIGAYTDFNTKWYAKMGPVLFFTFILNILVPIKLKLIQAMTHYVKRCLDNGFFRKKY